LPDLTNELKSESMIRVCNTKIHFAAIEVSVNSKKLFALINTGFDVGGDHI